MSDHYLFAGTAYYPKAPPGDFILRGTLDECREGARIIGSERPYRGEQGWPARGLGRFFYARHGGPNSVHPQTDGDDFREYESTVEWWRVVDADMQVVEQWGRAFGDA